MMYPPPIDNAPEPPELPERKFLDTPTIDKMLRDAGIVERNFAHSGPLMSMERDLCCHIKALAADREALHACRKANHETIRKLHDATIVLRNAIGKSACREQLRRDVDTANHLVDSVAGETMTEAFDSVNANVAKAKAVVERVSRKPSEIWNGWVPQDAFDDATHFIAKLVKEREYHLNTIKHLKWIIEQCTDCQNRYVLLDEMTWQADQEMGRKP